MSVEYYKSSSNSTKNDKNMPKLMKNVKTEPINLKIIEKFSPTIISFETPEEFKEYLSENIEELKNWTTQKLNTQYHINGYRITKIKGEISLRKVNGTNTNVDIDNDYIDANAIYELLNNLNTKIDKFINLLHQ
ncbi:hypothetical protein SDC9_104342 [bioreactor metagenome]|uniref:Uncharacterized protein n=1 Tax=bioreactor metagenome TaxID=1076179 RepID=A0A645AWI5_9ZZZZ